ncbi:cytochrome c peroxidase [Paracraurococcus lichenis]|uniref:Cytochrome c peroxidase n=1 Tax=Paracraurococcus lichenis TaxID=3064888 RepID=A0ABT9E0T6_9PROT|nr:cytochrome c peroxidase [Paracraurococcus sp. LOR1-02]MDO9709778.1 cytochrome c peroxidase [Paracraurococcus sp. LOR1-02]
MEILARSGRGKGAGRRSGALLKHAAVLAASVLLGAAALPEGSQIDPPLDKFPAQILRSEVAGGRQSFLVALGNTAFSSPLLYGETARQAGLSCNSCHVNGHANPDFHIPGHSARKGGLDPTGSLFNPLAEDGAENHVDIPSLRGIRFLGPYGRDGRIGSLREFARHVIVTEFGGPEPAPIILDALVAYMNEFEFIPNARMTGEGRLAEGATAQERRGEAAFAEACAGCHVPGTAFTDGRAHDVGSEGRFRTPTLMNVVDSAPYGHDGRWPDLDAAVAGHNPGLPEAQRADILAFLQAAGAAEDAVQPATFRLEMGELAAYVALLDRTITRGDAVLTRFVVDTVNAEMRRVERGFPQGDATRLAGRPDRHKQLPLDYAALRGGLDRVAALTEAGDRAGAAAALDAYHDMAEKMVANYPRPGKERR